MDARSSRTVRYAVASTKVVARLVTGAQAVHSGFWLGLLTPEQLDAATIEFYRTHDQFRDPMHNLRGLSGWETRVITAHTEPGTRVLVPSTGAGREILALGDLGYLATGYDPTPELVDLGRRLITETGSSAALLDSHGNGLPEGLNPPYDWALFGWGSISHVQGRENRIALFCDIHDVVSPGGVFIVSFLARQPHSSRFGTIYRVAKIVRDLRRSRDSLQLGDTLNGSFDHHFTFNEIAGELVDAGFEELERIAEPYPHMVLRRV
ncbi:MAG: hypothetical protein BMS9Abin12_2272 [Acidimicrobiia bacterium]|nr:MAG: hypothetical protein BMS9Abin12_2272 [Acidimicrobiia bacterium]